ncbi:hypothetical protein ABW19_dt0204941 [Dactylella cylindrospora]|nr:hypothetical protein ABW19_dt0204941 [Dactylella cylindrospora]
MPLGKRCISTVQNSTPRRDDAVIGSSPLPSDSIPPTLKPEDKPGNTGGRQQPNAPGARQSDTTDIGSNYTPPDVQEKVDSTIALREGLKDTTVLDAVTTAKEQKEEKRAGEKEQIDGQASTLRNSESEAEASKRKPTEPLLSPTIAKFHHNFDTFAMVKELEAAGFTYGQSVIAMKAIRGLLAVNLDKAKDSMVSKSMSENESYLFRAACSELKTEIESARRTGLEKTRMDRAQIQHDYDLLEQKLSEDLMNLKDEVSSLFHDRKMVTREEQRAMEVKLQELNYKLTIMLNGDMKSEIEALRWTTTRRGLIAIAIIAVLVVTLIRYSSVQSHATKKEASQAVKSGKAKDPLHAAADSGLIASLSSPPSGSRTDGGDNGDGGSFVSLG